MTSRGTGSHSRVHGQWAGLRVATVPWGLLKKPRPIPSLPAIRERLYLHLQRTNYVRPEDIAPYQGRLNAVRVMLEAGMVLYHEAKDLWVPDVGTLAWVIGQRDAMKQTTEGHD